MHQTQVSVRICLDSLEKMCQYPYYLSKLITHYLPSRALRLSIWPDPAASLVILSHRIFWFRTIHFGTHCLHTSTLWISCPLNVNQIPTSSSLSRAAKQQNRSVFEASMKLCTGVDPPKGSWKKIPPTYSQPLVAAILKLNMAAIFDLFSAITPKLRQVETFCLLLTPHF